MSEVKTINDNSILNNIKMLLGIEVDYTHFDPQIIIHINSALSTLYQIGGIKKPIRINSHINTWEEILGEREDLDLIKDYIYLKTRLIFDPPTSSFVLESIKAQIAELECRINYATDPDTTFVEEE